MLHLESEKCEISTLAGCVDARGSEDGTPDKCLFWFPFGIAMDEQMNNCFTSDCGNHRIRKITLIS